MKTHFIYYSQYLLVPFIVTLIFMYQLMDAFVQTYIETVEMINSHKYHYKRKLYAKKT